jgi:CO/xanthine dehydrogenase Mo-binding subunit
MCVALAALDATPCSWPTTTGVAAAVANAVFHATGVRVRDLPIALDKRL